MNKSQLANLLLTGSLLLVMPWAVAQTNTSTTGANTTALQPALATVPATRLADNFSGWAGSQENAAALVGGLRTGSAITLSTPAVDGTTTTTTTFSPTTKPMGYGNVRIALSLARTQLASQGITNPTPEQLQGALAGTPGSATQGVLQMRASGMGWGQIANSMGVKLGAVMSGKPVLTPATATTTTAAGTAARPSASTGYGSSQARKGIVTASGSSSSGAAASGKPAGITTASGIAAGGGVTTGLGNAYGHGHSGVVNAGGGKVGGVSAAAGGNGRGGGKP